MSNASGPKGVGSIRVKAPSPRARLVGARLRKEDVATLERLAADANVGLSTFIRLILEEYARLHGKGK